MVDCGYKRTVRSGGNLDRSFFVSGWNSDPRDAVQSGEFGRMNKEDAPTSSRGEGIVILRNCGFHLGHLVSECLDILLHEMTIAHRPEKDPTLPLTLSLPTVSAAFRAATGWHSSSGRSSGWSEKRRELDVTVPDSVSSLLLGHDMIKPFLRGRELALWLACSDFTGGVAVLLRCDRRGGGGSSRGSSCG